MLNLTIEKVMAERDEARMLVMEMFRHRLGTYHFEKQKYLYYVFDTYMPVRDYLITHGLIEPSDCVEVNTENE